MNFPRIMKQLPPTRRGYNGAFRQFLRQWGSDRPIVNSRRRPGWIIVGNYHRAGKLCTHKVRQITGY